MEYYFKKVKGDKILYYEKDKKDEWKEIEVCDWIELKAADQNLQTNEVLLTIEYKYGGRMKEHTFSRENLTMQGILELKKVGVDVKESRRALLLRYLEEEERKIRIRDQYQILGWNENYDVYYGFKPITLKNDEVLNNAIYIGDYKVEPKGDKNTWEQLIKSEVLSHQPLLFALTLGFAAPLVSYLKEELDLAVIFYHLVGGSTTGKTTATQLMVSPFGKPVTQDGGLLLKWNGTQNGIIGSIADHHGIPFGLDESSLSSGRDYTKFIYMIAEGIEKARMNQELENRERRTWSGVICSTGEHSLLRKSNQNDGLLSRVFEMEQVKWTTSAKQASKLKRTLINHYGHHGEQFVLYLMQQSKEDILIAYDEEKENLLRKMKKKDQYTERIIDRLAIIPLTAKYMKQCFKWDFDVQQVVDFIVEQDQENVDRRNVGDKAYDDVIQRVLRDYQHFSYNNQRISKEFKGRIEEKENGLEVVILPNVLKSYLREEGYEDAEIILSQWREKGYLSADPNKFTRKRKAEGDKKERILFNVILINDESIIGELKRQCTNPFHSIIAPERSESKPTVQKIPREFRSNSDLLKKSLDNLS